MVRLLAGRSMTAAELKATYGRDAARWCSEWPQFSGDPDDTGELFSDTPTG